MNARVVGIAACCAVAMVGCLLLAPKAGAEALHGLDLGDALRGGAGNAETFLRRQPAPVSPRSRPTLRRQRRGTLSLGVQGGYGLVRGASELNDHFDQGLSYAFRFRYMLSSRSALGFSFENQHYGVRAGLTPSLEPFASDSELVVTTVSSEAMVFFHRERETNPYLLGGLGFASPNVRYARKESRRVDEGPFAVVGAGLEKFFRPRVSLDLCLRGYAQVGNSELSTYAQISAGIHLYPGD